MAGREEEMALKIRLARRGAKKNPFYRVVIQDIETARDGKFLEIVGTYDPRKEEEKEKLIIKKDRYDFWYGKGARPTSTVNELIKKCAV